MLLTNGTDNIGCIVLGNIMDATNVCYAGYRVYGGGGVVLPYVPAVSSETFTSAMR